MLYSDTQMEIVGKLERFAGYIGREPDDECRDLIADLQDEFEQLKRGAVREGLETDERLNVQDVLNLGASMGEDFPEAQRGAEAFASVVILERMDAAPMN